MILISDTLWTDYLQTCGLQVSTAKEKPLRKILYRAFKDRGFRAVCLYRIGRYYRLKGNGLIPFLVETLIVHLCLLQISTNADIGPGFNIQHPFGTVVGTDVKAGKNLSIRQGTTLGANMDQIRPDGTTHPIIGDNVLIGVGAHIIGPISVGDNCVIGANAVVVSDIPANSIAAGVPARIIKKNGKAVGILEQGGAMAKLLHDILLRLERLEMNQKLSNH